MRNRNKALLLILCGIFQNTPVVESMEFGKNSGDSLLKKNLIGKKRKFSSDKKSDNSVSEKDFGSDIEDDLSNKKSDNFEEKYNEPEKEYGGGHFTISSPISLDGYLKLAYLLDKKFNDNDGDIFKDEYFHSDSKSFKTALRFNEIYDYESEDSENEFINNQENINKLKTLLNILKRKIKTSEKIKKEDVAGLCEDVIGGVFTNSRTRKHGIEFAKKPLDKNKKYKFRHLLFHKLFNTFNKRLNGGVVSFINIYINDFGNNSIEVIDKKYTDNSEKPHSCLKFAFQSRSSDKDFIDITGKAAVLEKTECKRYLPNNTKKYNNYQFNGFKFNGFKSDGFKFDVENTLLTDTQLEKYLNNGNICKHEDIVVMFKLVDIIFNKELDSSYLDDRQFRAKYQREDTLNIAVSLKDFIKDQEFLQECISLTPQCKRLVCHILARLASQSVALMDGGKLGAGIINRELNKINLGRKKRENPIGELLKKLDESKIPEDKDIKDDIKKCD